MIEKRWVQLYAHGAGVDLDIAEREIVLTYVLRVLSDLGLLGGLAFKGGTAIRKLYLGRTGRFSLDLDFTATGNRAADTLIVDLVDSLHDRTYYGVSFTIANADYWATDDSCGAEITYRHDWVQRGHFGVQISCRATPVLPVGERDLLREPYFEWMGVEPPSVPALDLHEVIGEKVRAAAQRSRVRDFYDLYQLAGKPYDRTIVRRIAVIKCWETRYAFDPVAFLAGLPHGSYDWSDLSRLVRRDRLPRPDEIIKSVQGNYAFLKELTPEEARLAADPYGRQAQVYSELVDGLKPKTAQLR